MLQPNTIAAELHDDLQVLLESGLQYSNENSTLSALEKKSKNLSKVSPAEGYLALATVSMLRGDFSEMRSRYDIALNQGVSAGHKINYVTTLSHAGFFSEAAAMVKKTSETCPAPLIFMAFLKAAACFQFQTSIALFNKAKSQKLIPPEGYIEMVNTFGDVSRIAGVDDVVLAQLADLAGEVMREHGIYSKSFPTLHKYLNDDGVDFVVSSFLVPVPYEDASEMTLSFAEKVYMHGLENERFLIRFFGQA